MPAPGERAQVGTVDPSTGGFSPIATTGAWSFPLGAMLAWCPISPDEELLFNDTVEGSAVGVRLNVHSGARQVYMRPLSAVGGAGALAASVSLGRISRLHKGEGATVADTTADEAAPEGEGIHVIGLSTGLVRLVVSVASVAAMAFRSCPALRRRELWFEHVSFNPGGSRLAFTAFAGGPGLKPDGAIYTIGIDGTGLHEAVPFGRGVTRAAWLDETRTLATFRGRDDVMCPQVVADTPGNGEPEPVGECSGLVHATPSRCGRFLAIESENSHRRVRTLSVVDRNSGETRAGVDFPIGDPAHLHGPCRCELSPRWDDSGSTVCVDAIGAEGSRQLHLVPLQKRVSKSER